MISSFPAARVGRWSRSTRMGCILTAPGLPRVSMFFFTATARDFPGALVASRTAESYVQGGSTFSITLSPAVQLTAGTYWVSVQCRMDFHRRPVGLDRPDSAVQQRRSLAKSRCRLRCLPYLGSKGLTCLTHPGGPDQVFRLNGTLGGGTPTPTPTPEPVTTIPLSVRQVTLSCQGHTDIGNHCDDCTTAIVCPFPDLTLRTSLTPGSISPRTAMPSSPEHGYYLYAHSALARSND